MTYAPWDGGCVPPIDEAEAGGKGWGYFLERILPTAEEAGVGLALHPDDPPMPRLRQTARLVYRPELYQRLIDMEKSSANKLELCLRAACRKCSQISRYMTIWNNISGRIG